MITLYEHSQKREAERLKFHAKVAGAEIKEKDETKFMFKDPKDYEDLPMEERQKLTNEMKTYFMGKLGGGKLGG